MANQQPPTTTPEREHSLPETFIDKREELYLHKSNIDKALITRDQRLLKEATLEYMTVLSYICNRIKPKLRGNNKDAITEIQAYILTALIEVQPNQTIPVHVRDRLDRYHETVTQALINYGLDQITPTILNI
jgi:uncharacterized protein YjcR